MSALGAGLGGWVPGASGARSVRVGAEPPYEVVIGRGVASGVAALLGEPPRQVLVVHQPSMSAAAEQMLAGLRAIGFEPVAVEVPDGEAAKTADVASTCWTALGQASFTRSDAVLGIGGGAVTDLAGFVGATWMRGVDTVLVPTTLLAMVDAAVGGKTGINTAEGKNLVGAFHHPRGVVCDLSFLATLPLVDLTAGLAEVVKCGFIADTEILDLVEADPAAATDPRSDLLADLVERAVAVKAAVVGEDFRESGLREILNYGHTLAHAIEQVESFTWRHGDAVAVGMVFAAELARLAGRLDDAAVDRHRAVLAALGLPTSYPAGRWPDLQQALRRDKKHRGSRMRFVVLDAIGRPGRLEGPPPTMVEAAYELISRG